MCDKIEQSSNQSSNQTTGPIAVPEPRADYSAQKIYQFPFEVGTISKFCPETKDAPDFFLINGDKLYDVKNNEPVYDFKKRSIYRLHRDGYTISTHSNYIYNFPLLTEIYTESVPVGNNGHCKYRITVSKNDFDGKKFNLVKSKTFDSEWILV